MGDDATKPKAKPVDGDGKSQKGDKGDRQQAVADRASSTASEEVTTATKAGFEIPKVDPLNKDPERISAVLQLLVKSKSPEQLAAMGIKIGPDGVPILPGAKLNPNPDARADTVEPVRQGDQPIVAPVDQTPKIPVEQTKATVDALAQITGERDRQLQGDAPQFSEYSYIPPFNASAFKTLMATKNEQERSEADAQFKKQFGHSLEEVARANLSGSDLADALKVLRRKDGDMVGQRADDIGFSLDTGASGWGFEKNIRDIYSSSTKAQIDQMDQKYRADHPDKPGIGLYDSIMANPNVSAETKDALKILNSGADHRTPEETSALATIGLKNKDIGFFQEAMAKATPEARAKFLQDGGAAQIQDAFGINSRTRSGGPLHLATTDSQHALDYAKFGKLSAVTQIRDNTGTIGWTTNDKGLDQAVNSMNDTERKLYMTGKQLAEHPEKVVDGLSPADKIAAQTYYKELHDAISNSGNATNVLKLEDMIATKDGGFIASLAQMRGTVYNSSVEDIKKSIQTMSQKDWQDLREHPERRDDVEKMLRSLNKGDSDVKDLMAVFDAKVNPTAEATKALKSIQEMPPEDRKRYQQDETFRKDYDAKLKVALGEGPGVELAQHMLDQIKNGKNPVMDLPDRLMANALYEQNPTKAKADIDQALKDDPTLAERLKHPTSDADKAFAERLQKSIAALQSPDGQKRLFELSQDAGKQPVLDLLKANAAGMFSGANIQASVDAVKNMSAPDQRKYREDQQYREQVDKQIVANITNPELLHSVQRMMEHVKAGEKPVMDVVGSMIISTDQKQTVRDLAKAFKDDPALRERITNPKTPEDKQFSEDFKTTVKNQLGLMIGIDGSVIQNDYTSYANDLLKTGHVPIEKMAELERGLFSADADKLFDHLKDVTPEEKQKLLTDKPFQDQVFSGLSDEQRKVALAVVKQGDLLPEDKIRMNIIGWGGSTDVATATKAMTPKEMAEARARYASKYAGDFDNDVLNKTSGQDKFDVKRALAGQLSFEEQQEALRKEGIDTRSGFGAWASDRLFNSATGSQADSAMEQMGHQFTDYEVALSKGMTDPKQVTEYQERIRSTEALVKTALDNHRDSKAAAADAVTDVAIGVVGVGSVIVSGGTSIPLIAGLGLSMGFVKMGTKAAMMGNDYESSQALRDFTSGVIGGATSVLGPGELAAIFKVGATAAERAVLTTLKDVGTATVEDAASATLKAALKPGAETELVATTQSLMRHALTSGAAGIEPSAIKAAADAAISSTVTGEAREKAVAELTRRLEANLQTQWEQQSVGLLNGIKKQVIEQGYNAAAGVAGASAMSITQDVMDGKSADEIIRDAFAASAMGGFSALGMANAMKWGGHVLSHVRARGATEAERDVAANTGTRIEQAIVNDGRDAAASMPHRSNEEMLAMWNKALADNEGKPLSVVKGYYEAAVREVDKTAHPNGLVLSTTESPMKLHNDVTVKYPDGSSQTFKAGTELPNGMQISPTEITVDKELRTISGGQLITISADGAVLKTGEISGPLVFEKGQIAQPGQFIVSRPSTDLATGAPRIDTYTNKDLSRWQPIDDKPGLFAPKIAGATPVEVIKVPEGYQGTFDVSYGGVAPFKPGDLIVREEKTLDNGTIVPAFRRISQEDGLETYLPADAASTKAFADSIESLQKEHPELRIVRAADSAEAFYKAASMPHRSTGEMLAMWNKALADNEGKPLSVVKGYYEAAVREVDKTAHPNGLILSTTESPMKLHNDVTVKYPDGSSQTFKAGTELPNGMQISPTEITVDKELRTISGGQLITISADGAVLKTGEISGPLVFKKGQIAQPGQFIVSRPSTDLATGAPRIDTYTNKDLSRWQPIDDKPGLFAPKIAGATPVEVIKVPEGYQGTFDVSYGGVAPFKPGDLIVREEKTLDNGTIVPAFRRISQEDGLETYLPADAASTKAFADSLKSIQEKYPQVKITRAASAEQEFRAAAAEQAVPGARRIDLSKDQTFVGDDGLVYKYHADGKMPDVTGSFELANTQPFKAEIATEPFTYTNAKGEQVQAAAGDYRITRADGYVYAEKPEIFSATHSERPGRPGEFELKPGTTAQQVLENSAIPGIAGGLQTAHKGDWLVVGPEGEKTFLTSEQFAERYSAKALNPQTPFGYYLKSLPIKAERAEPGTYFHNPDGAVGAKPTLVQDGDMIAHPIGQAPYLIPGKYFQGRYVELSNGEWARKDLTMAQKLEKHETTWSPGSGLTEGDKGDYLVTRDNGNQEIIPRVKFEEQLALYSEEPNQVSIAGGGDRFTPEVLRAETHQIDMDGEKSLTSPVHLTVSQALDESSKFPLGLSANLITGELHFTFAHMVLDDIAKAVRAPLQEIRDGIEVRVNGVPIASKLRQSQGLGDPEFMEWTAPKHEGSSTIEFNFYGRRIGLYSYNPEKNIMMKLDSSKSLSAFDIREFHAKRGFGEVWRESGAVIDPTEIPANQIDLHTHFAGSMRAETIMEVAQKARTPFPTELLDEFKIKYNAAAVKIVDGKPTVTLDSENFPVGSLQKLQKNLGIPEDRIISFKEMEAIYRLRTPLVKDLKAFPLYLEQIAKDYKSQGVRYAELSLSDVLKPEWLEAARASLPEIERQTGVKLRFIVGMWRHSEHDYNEELVKKIIALGHEPLVVGADFMGEESNKTLDFADELRALAEYRKIRPEFQIRVHAGENPMNLANIKEAIELGATRIGHGVYGVDAETLALAKEHDVIIEFNTNSNLALSNIEGSEQLPVKDYLDAGVRISLGTDGHGLYGTSARSEEAVMKSLGLTKEDLAKITESDRRYTDMMERLTADNRTSTGDAQTVLTPPVEPQTPRADEVARTADAAQTFYTPDAMPHRSTDEMSAMWDKAIADNQGKPLSVVKGYYEAAVREVDKTAHPNGLVLSTTESPMKLHNDVTVKYPDGSSQTFKAGTELPNGMQISPTDITVDKELRTITGGKLITISADGSVLKTGEISGPLVFEKGQIAKPGEFIVSRPSTDLATGAPRIDTYTNGDLSRWQPIEDKPGLFAPKISGAKPVEVIKVPEGYQGTFDVSYGGVAPFKPGDLIVREEKTLPDGSKVPAYRRISQEDGLETYLPADAASKKAFDDSAKMLRDQYPELTLTRAAVTADEFTKNALRARVAEQFPRYENISQGQYQVTQELAAMRVRSNGGVTVGKLLAAAPLQAEQKERILRALAEVREQFANHRVDVNGKSVIDPVQKLNWEHTAREIGTVLEIGQRLKLSGNELEDAVLASMFSDAVKNAGNFTTHHLDGAIAAEHVLSSHDMSIGQLGQVLSKYSDKNFTPERVQGIIKAILQTQSSPPKLMSELYGALLKPQNEAEQLAAQNIKKYIADPLTAPYKDTPSGRTIDFSPEEKALLKRDTGLTEWHVSDATSKQFKISEAVLMAESEETYRSLKGLASSMELRGPGTGTRDAKLDASLRAVQADGRDALDLAARRGEQIAAQIGENTPFSIAFKHELRAQRLAATRTELPIMQAKTNVEKWLREVTGTADGAKLPDIPYWNSELKYPNRGASEEQWSKINSISETARTPEQQKFWQDNQYGDLNPKEIDAFKFAEQIQDRFAKDLRGDAPVVDYAPVMTAANERARLTGRAAEAVSNVDAGTAVRADEVKLDTQVAEYIKVAPVRAEKINLSSGEFSKDASGHYYFTDPDTGALKPIGTDKDVANGYKDYAGYKVYKADGSSYVNDNFVGSHVPVPGMDKTYFKTEVVRAQEINTPLRINTGKSVEEYNPGDMMVLSGNNPAYPVRRTEWDSLYAKQGGQDLSDLSLKLPPAIGLQREIGANQTEQFWYDGVSGGTIRRTYDPDTGGIKSLTLTDDKQGWTKYYENNKLQSETVHVGDKVYTKNYNYDHAQEVADLPPTQKVVDQLNEDKEYQKVKEVAENAKVPEYSRDNPADKAYNEKVAQRIFEQVFLPPYEGATVVSAEQATAPFTWTNKLGEVVKGNKGDFKVFNADGTLATVIEPQFFDQAYKAAGDGKWEFVPPQKGNRVDIFNGLPGSGKTTNINKVRSKFGSRIVEADDNKTSLEGFHQDVDAAEFGPTLAARNGLGAKHLLARSNDINDLVLMKALKEGYNVVLPGVGAGDPTWMINFLRDLKSSGREVYAHFIEIPPAESARRVASRFKYELNNETPTGARLVQPEFMVTHGEFPRQNFDRMVKELFKEGEGLDGYEIIWNYGKQPRVLEEGHRNPN